MITYGPKYTSEQIYNMISSYCDKYNLVNDKFYCAIGNLYSNDDVNGEIFRHALISVLNYLWKNWETCSAQQDILINNDTKSILSVSDIIFISLASYNVRYHSPYTKIIFERLILHVLENEELISLKPPYDNFNGVQDEYISHNTITLLNTTPFTSVIEYHGVCMKQQLSIKKEDPNMEKEQVEQYETLVSYIRQGVYDTIPTYVADLLEAADDKDSTKENRIHILLQMVQHNAIAAESAMNTLLDTLTGAVSKSNDAIMPIEATQLRMIASPIKEQMIATITDIVSVLINEINSTAKESGKPE